MVQVGRGPLVGSLELDGYEPAARPVEGAVSLDVLGEPLVLDGCVDQLLAPPANDVGTAFVVHVVLEEIDEPGPHPSWGTHHLEFGRLALGPLDRGVDGPAGDERSLGRPGDILDVGEFVLDPAVSEGRELGPRDVRLLDGLTHVQTSTSCFQQSASTVSTRY